MYERMYVCIYVYERPQTHALDGAATLEPNPTQHSKINIFLGIHRQTRLATFNPTCLSRLIATSVTLSQNQLVYLR